MGFIRKKIRSTMSGTGIPYFIGNDNLLTTLFMLTTLGAAYIMVLNGGNILQRLKNIFYYTGNSKPYNNQTHINRFSNIILDGQAILFLSVAAFTRTQYNAETNTGHTHIQWLFYFIAFFLFFMFKRAVYAAINNILFSKKQETEWKELYLFTIRVSGCLLFPMVAAQLVIPHIRQGIFTAYLAVVGFLCLLMLIKGCKRIIFPQNRGYLDIILYLCTLEILPIFVIFKATEKLNTFITINF